MANVTKINYKNNEYSLDGVSLEQALELLHIDKDSVTMETEGDTLYIMAKAGSKGAVESSAIQSFDMVDGVLQITFNSGAVYAYPQATAEDFKGLTEAESKGKFFNQHIAKQEFKKIK